MSSKDAPAHSTRSKAKEQQHDNTPATKAAEDDQRVSPELTSGAEFGSERSGPSITGSGSPPTAVPQGSYPEGDIDKNMLEGYQEQEDAKIAKELQEKADAEYAQQLNEELNADVQHSEGAAPDDEEENEGMYNDSGLHGEDTGDLPVIIQPTQPQNEASDIYEHIYAIGQCRGALKRQEQTLQRYEDRLGLTQNMHAAFNEMHYVLKQCSSSLRMSLGGISEDEIQRKHKERLQTSKQKMQKAPEDDGGTKRKRDDGDDSEGEKEDEGGEDRGKKGKPKRPKGSDRNAKDNRKKKDGSDDEHDETYGKEPQVQNGRASYGRKPKEHQDG